VYQNFISYLYETQHVSGDTPPIIRSLKRHLQPLVLHAWKVVRRCCCTQNEIAAFFSLHVAVIVSSVCVSLEMWVDASLEKTHGKITYVKHKEWNRDRQ